MPRFKIPSLAGRIIKWNRDMHRPSSLLVGTVSPSFVPHAVKVVVTRQTFNEKLRFVSTESKKLDTESIDDGLLFSSSIQKKKPSTRSTTPVRARLATSSSSKNCPTDRPRRYHIKSKKCFTRVATSRIRLPGRKLLALNTGIHLKHGF